MPLLLCRPPPEQVDIFGLELFSMLAKSWSMCVGPCKCSWVAWHKHNRSWVVCGMWPSSEVYSMLPC